MSRKWRHREEIERLEVLIRKKGGRVERTFCDGCGIELKKKKGVRTKYTIVIEREEWKGDNCVATEELTKDLCEKCRAAVGAAITGLW